MQIALNGNSSMPYPLLLDVRLVRDIDGSDGLIVVGDKLRRCELLSPQHWEIDPWETARDLRRLLTYLFL